MTTATLLRGEPPAWAASLYGYGDGDGYGYGYGYGDGYGYGYGDGDGYGYGDGDGDGDGYGDGSYWLKTISFFARRWSDAQRARLEELKSNGARLAFWKSTNAGTAANGGSCAPVQPGTVHKEPGPIRDQCGEGQLHATLLPATKWQGERWWVVALIGEVRGDDEKLWALEREIIGECL